MIYICDFNSALDYRINLNSTIELNDLNRFKEYDFSLGGKGINNALVLNNLKINSTLIGFNGGFVGNHIKDLLANYSFINYKSIAISDCNRINVKLFGIKKEKEIEINGQGPKIQTQNVTSFMTEFKSLKNDDVVILVGSKPLVEENVFELVCQLANNKKSLLIIDTNKKILDSCLKFKPFLIKPNHFELEEFFDIKIDINDKNLLIKYCQKLITKGAKNVLLSLGDKGALFVSDEKKFFIPAIKEKVINTVGAGDSMVAGFVKKYIKTKDLKESFKFAVACGSASAFSKDFPDQQKVEKYFKILSVEGVRDEN